MSSETFKEDKSLFNKEEEYLAKALRLLQECKNGGTIDWAEEFGEMTSQYEKLLHQTRKLVRISDLAQRNLHIANNKIQEMADTDKLTRLPNRRGTINRLENEIQKMERNGNSLVLFILDIDLFKTINDKYGHAAGDYVLELLAMGMRTGLRQQDILGRWGGEEFILALPDTDREGAGILSEKIRILIERLPIIWQEEKLKITMSFGGTVYNRTLDLNGNLDNADKALYSSKKAGRNRITFYED